VTGHGDFGRDGHAARLGEILKFAQFLLGVGDIGVGEAGEGVADDAEAGVFAAEGLVAPASLQSPAFDVLATTKSPAVVDPSNEHGTYPRYVITAFPLVPDPLLTIPITPSVSAVPAFNAQDGVAELYFARKFSEVPVDESLHISKFCRPEVSVSNEVAA
jgi:hypothetical protein